jgi:hypothetical protein
MSSSDRMLIPACSCGSELQLCAPHSVPGDDVTHVDVTHVDVTHVRVYRCHDCGHETRIIVWGADVCEAYTPLAPSHHEPAHDT